MSGPVRIRTQVGPKGVARMRGDPFERMYSTTRELLWRQRQIHLFPCDKEKVLLSLMPREMSGWCIHPHRPLSTVEWSNLARCLNTHTSVVVELGGEIGRAFWMRFDTQVPAPSNSSAFEISTDNQYYREVSRWWGEANEIHEELKLYQSALWDFLQRASHPLLVEKYWPGLYPFVGFEAEQSAAIQKPDLEKRRIIPLPTPEQCDSIIECLAASTLLQGVSCSAWVDYEVEEEA